MKILITTVALTSALITGTASAGSFQTSHMSERGLLSNVNVVSDSNKETVKTSKPTQRSGGIAQYIRGRG